jgi:plastocyanin
MSQLGPSFRIGAVVLVLAFGVSAAALYGASLLVDQEETAAANGGGGEVVPGGPVNVTIVAKNILFDPRSIRASTGAQITVTLDNQDAGVLHDITFYGGRTATGTPLAKTDTFPGVAQRTVSFTAPSSAGNYAFRCTVHPDTMTGTLQVQ